MSATFILIDSVVIIVMKMLPEIMKLSTPAEVVSKSLSLAGFLN